MHNSGFLRAVRAALAVVVLVAARTSADAATILVRAGENLQSALNAAQPGDTIVLQAGATFTGNFVLPVKSGTEFITLRSDDSSGTLPPDGTRVGPADAHLLAKIRSGNTMAALRTAPGAHHWRLQLLEVQANRDGYSDIIQIGDGSSAQNHPSLVPYEIDLDRLYVHGDPRMGQKRGIALNGRSVTIRNCHISDIRGVGMDTQAIGGWNGTGPYLIENNYLEAAGENVMIGGADPSIPYLVPSNIIVRNNYFSRPMSWRDPVVATPRDLSTEVQPGGSLMAGGYSYRVVARKRVAGGVTARSSASPEISVQVADGQAVRLTWTAIADADDYQVYARTPGGASHYWITTAASFVDSGAAGRAGAAPTSAGSTWTVKNIFELKNARNVVVDHNIFENHWGGAQAGYAIVFTPRNQDGGCAWCVVEDVTFTNNVVRNAAAGINILGHDDLQPSLQTNRIRVRNNVFHLRRALGGPAWFMLIGNGPRDITVDHNTIDADGTTVLYVYGYPAGGVRPITGFQFTNNAGRHGDYGINGAEASFGSGIIGLYFTGGVVAGNWLQGGPAARYPNNYVDGTFVAAFTDASAGNYTVQIGGPLTNRATDGGHIGAATEPASMINAILAGRYARPAAPSGMRIVVR